MNTLFIRPVTLIVIASCLVVASPAMAAEKLETQTIRKEIQALKKSYESRINQLETRLKNLEEKRLRQSAKAPATSSRSISDNSYNPSISVILNGKASSFSRSTSEFSGFGVGEEGERGKQGLAIDESELNFSGNIDDKFFGSTTVAIVREDGSDKIELEEAYIQTLPGAGLPDGTRIKAGRAFWTLGYLNEHHTHADDFVDRPLPYRAYLNSSFNDDGVEFSYVLPTDIYSEIGGGIFRGDDFPAGDSSSGLGAWSAFARIGGDFGDNQSWRLGGYVVHSDVNSRQSNENTVTFVGKSDLYAADLRYVWTPTGNPKQSEVILQAEYFHRLEDGTYNDATAGTGSVAFDEGSSGWYAQSVYKFAPNWRVGARYARMQAPDIPVGLVGSAIDGAGHDPSSISIMGDWTNSEFGRLRLQYSREELSSGSKDNQFYLQYIMSLGAHGAHAF
jgi:hypothetical protein